MLSSQDVAAGVGAQLLGPVAASPSRCFVTVVADSRRVVPGALFVALPGERTDGHRFIADAVTRGATGVLARGWPDDAPAGLRERATLFPVADPLLALQQLAAYWRSRHPVRTVGVTGSVGKTSTKEAIAGLLSGRSTVLKSTGNLNTEIGVPLVLLQLTPQHTHLVVEMGMHHVGDIALLCTLARPQLGVVTNVGPTHLERLGTLQRIVEAKTELPASLPAEGVAVLNADDPLVRAMAGRTAARVVTYGTSPAADCHASSIRTFGLEGLEFDLRWGGQRRRVRTALLGRHNVYTALAASAVALLEGCSLDDVAHGLAGLADTARIRVRHTAAGALVLDDTYNASPASVMAALDLLADLPGRRVAVLADMLELGAEEANGHRTVGEHAARRAEALVAIGPRAATIAEAAAAAGLGPVRHFATKDEALPALRELDRQGNVLLFKGSRGMALDELVATLCEQAR